LGTLVADGGPADAGAGNFAAARGAYVCTRGLSSSKSPPPVAKSGPPLDLGAGACAAAETAPDAGIAGLLSTEPLGVSGIDVGIGATSTDCSRERGSVRASFKGVAILV
jgi:hypothetical protein